MTRDGAVSENKATGASERISEREAAPVFAKPQESTAPQPEQLLKPPLPLGGGAKPDTGIAERVINRADTEIKRHKYKKRIRKANNAARQRSGGTQRLEFSEAERADPALDKYIRKSDKVADRLDRARANIPKQRRPVIERVFDEPTGKSKARLRFEEVDKAPGGKLKRNPFDRPLREAGTAIHGEIHKAEGENAGVEGAHKAEELGERAGGIASRKLRERRRSQKLQPYRAAAKAEKRAFKANVNAQYHRALRENPTTNPLSKMLQKRKIRKDYAKSLRKGTLQGARGAAATAKKTAQKATQTAQKTAAFIARHKKPIIIIAAALMLLMFMFSALSSCGAMLGGGTNAIIATSYTAEDAEFCAADLLYTELEARLQERINNIETEYSGYDEYRYQIDEIGHDPHELIAYLTVKYEDFTFAEVESAVRELFGGQYSLAITETIEIRYRTETYTDPETGESYDVQVPYEWRILNIQLTSTPLFGVLSPQMTADQTELYHMLMESKGNRQNFGNPFSVPWQPYVTCLYGYRIHPITGEYEMHNGLDIGMAGGTPILSIMEGTVITAGSHSSYGNYVVIENEKGYRSLYAHCQSLSVSSGQAVAKGQEIGRVGTTGTSTGNHLHLELTDPTGAYLNPYFFIQGTSEYTPPAAPAGRSARAAGASYTIPPEALTDERFAAMITEAEKYLGYPYVWGGSTPETSFDCSGFVCWVINQSGVGSVGRTNAQGLYNHCTPVSAEEAKPGDLVFFTGTYDSAGPVSHVAVYVGGGMVIHAGKPIQYTSIDTPYWRSHFYSYGRLP